MTTYNVLIMGASYGSLLATKLLFGGHKITMVCLPAEVEAFNNDGARVRLPIRGRKEPIELDSRKLPGKLAGRRPRRRQPDRLRSRRAGDAGAAIPLARRARAARRGGAAQGAVHVDHEHAAPALSEAHPRARRPTRSSPPITDASVWDNFEPGHADPVQPRPAGDPPARREDQRAAGHLADQFQGRPGSTPTNPPRCCARWRRTSRRRATIRATARSSCRSSCKVHDSIFVPLAKWAMLLTGNYRCVTEDGAIDIKDAVHRDLETSRSVYNWVLRRLREARRHRRTIWCRSRNTPPPRTTWCGRPRPRARSTTARPTSSGPTGSCS